MLPPKDKLTICFAHVVYHFDHEFKSRKIGVKSFEVRDRNELSRRIGEADVLVCSSMWQNSLVDHAERLRFIQCNGAGTEQFDLGLLGSRGLRLASGQGSNSNAVAQHGFALILGLMRLIPQACENQSKRVWRPMTSDPSRREDELGGKTMVVVGFGHVGSLIGRLAKAFGMRVVGLKRDLSAGGESADALHGMNELASVLPQADFVVLACPLTAETKKLIDAPALSLMKDTAYLINLSRGGCVDEPALIRALESKEIAGAGLDVVAHEPLSPDLPLWGMRNVILTPHSAGETRSYEKNVVDVLLENIGRLDRGERMINQVL